MRRYPAFVLVLALIATFVGFIAGAPPAAAGVGDDSGTAVYASPAQIRYGQSLTVEADVADLDAFTGDCSFGDCLPLPNGRVDFYTVENGVQSATLFTSGLLQDDKASGRMLQSSGTGEITYCCLKPGTYTIRGYYVPGNYKASSDNTDTPITVTAGNTTTQLNPSAGTTLGQEASFSAFVFSEGPTETPTGFVSLVEQVGNATITYDTEPLVNGTATLKTTQLSGGAHNLVAVYGGNSLYNGSRSNTVAHSVGKGTVTNTLTASTDNAVFGQPVTFNAVVAPVAPATITPTGTADLFGSTGQLGVKALVSGAASWTATLPVGNYVGNSCYSGDASYGARCSEIVRVAVTKANSTTALSSSANPSTVGQAVTLTATVSPVAPSTATPTGTVQFFDGATALSGALPLNNGQASFTSSTLGGGAHAITAVYSGSAGFNASTSPVLNQTVTCNQTYSGDVGSVVVGPGTTCFTNANLGGALNIPAGARISIVNSTIGGLVTTSGAPAAILICGSTLRSHATVSNTTGPVIIGDPDNGCAGNSIAGNATLTSNHGGVRFIGNRVGGTLAVRSNDGGQIVVGGNTVAGRFDCSGNNPLAVNGGKPNSSGGGRSGECAAAGF